MSSAGMTRIVHPSGKGPFVIVCDHASNYVPDEFQSLGLPDTERARHIAWDIGAAGITHYLCAAFDSPGVLCGASRLVIDCNRQLNALDLIPEISDGTVIGGNLNLTAQDKTNRIRRWFHPYHDAVRSVLDERLWRRTPVIFLSIHSMTENLAGVERPWEIALSSYRDRTLAEPLIAALRVPGDMIIGDNRPYDLDPEIDFTTPFHAFQRGLPHIQVEFRQDKVRGETGQRNMAERFAAALREVLAYRNAGTELLK